MDRTSARFETSRRSFALAGGGSVRDCGTCSMVLRWDEASIGHSIDPRVWFLSLSCISGLLPWRGVEEKIAILRGRSRLPLEQVAELTRRLMEGEPVCSRVRRESCGSCPSFNSIFGIHFTFAVNCWLWQSKSGSILVRRTLHNLVQREA